MSYYSTGEVSKKLNLSVRTLRYYDQIDLITPSFKDEHGKRFYNDADVLKIEKVTILKSLQLPLKDIKKVLSQLTIEQLLSIHKQSLRQNIAELEQAVLHTNTLLNILKVEGDLQWEHLIPLVRKERSDEKEKGNWNKFFDEEEQTILQEQLPKLEQDDKLINKWMNLLKRIDLCVAKNIGPESEEGKLIASDVLLLTDEMFAGNRELEEKFWRVRKSADKSGLLNLYPIKKEVICFLEDAIYLFEQARE